MKSEEPLAPEAPPEILSGPDPIEHDPRLPEIRKFLARRILRRQRRERLRRRFTIAGVFVTGLALLLGVTTFDRRIRRDDPPPAFDVEVAAFPASAREGRQAAPDEATT